MQIQALDRAPPTTTNATGRRACSPRSRSAPCRVTTEARARRTGSDFLAFLRRVERAYPGCELRVALDNVSTHKTPAVRAWLEQHPRIAFHFTPTSASWMNRVETWFSVLTRQAIRRGAFRSVKDLVARIDQFIASWNAGASPFVWIKTSNEILAKAVRKRPATSDQRIGTLALGRRSVGQSG